MSKNFLTSGTAIFRFMYCLEIVVDVNKKKEVSV